MKDNTFARIAELEREHDKNLFFAEKLELSILNDARDWVLAKFIYAYQILQNNRQLGYNRRSKDKEILLRDIDQRQDELFLVYSDIMSITVEEAKKAIIGESQSNGSGINSEKNYDAYNTEPADIIGEEKA